MTLREKIDALDAIEILIKHYEEDELQEAIKEDIRLASEEIVGPDFVGYYREEIDKLKKAKKKLIEEIKQDPNVLAYTEEQTPRL